MSNADLSRRDLLRSLGNSLILTTAGIAVLPPVLAQHVHQEISEIKSLDTKGDYQPKYLSPHEYSSLRRLADLIIPADEHSPGALAGGAPEFIDFLCSRNRELGDIYTGGLAWVDRFMELRHQTSFIDAPAAQQTELLDLIAFRKNDSPQLAPGIRFFVWARNMVVDAFYTSPAGVQDLGFMGNKVLSQFSVPQDAIDYAIKRSPFA